MITAVKGTQDIFLPQVLLWQRLEASAREIFRRYGVGEIRTPILEPTELFVRGIGDETDIVTKEMYTFLDKSGRSLTMRPENTAGVVRSLVEHRLHDSPAHSRLYYIGPQFRYERPQKGRYRQFHQIGLEFIGEEAPGCDAEGIAAAVDILRAVGIPDILVQINSVGCPACRPPYVALLKASLEAKGESLCADCRRRLETNPLRVLDCKVPHCQPVLDSAPRIAESLCAPCAEHYAAVKAALGILGVPFHERHRLVRGLDYYVRTVFEVTSAALGAQDALLGGGRYDGLLKQIGGPDAPGFGWALGMERILLAIPTAPDHRLPWVYLAWNGEGTWEAGLSVARRLREAGIPVVMEHGARSFKSALKRADRMQLRWTLLLGEEEKKSGTFTLKDMASATQEALGLEGVVQKVGEGSE
jgi:histidyl-tRNA synthetase